MTEYKRERILRNVQKPGRYIGGEPNAVYKDKSEVRLRFAFCFPDIYEIGMSHVGIKILYSIMNRMPGVWCERCFAPWFDMKQQMEENGMLLSALESGDPLNQFDIVGFTLQYEMSYTNILYMLDFGGIPILQKDRKDGDPIVIAGGPCACNPEPLCDFIDAFVLGDGEELNPDVCRCVMEAKEKSWSRKKTLIALSKIKGVYIPSFYHVVYNPNKTIKRIDTVYGAPQKPEKRIAVDLNACDYFESFPIPMIETVHDRATIEVLRGCKRGCRFCQAGFIYRPFRARSAELLDRQAQAICANSGYDELSLTSLSTGDHPELGTLLSRLVSWTEEKKINLSLPSLRLDNFTNEMIEKTTRVRKSGLTFAPEAGTQRLRDVINKNITEEEVLSACDKAFKNGYMAVKLYFMIGLPTETDEDIVGIAQLAQKVVDLYYKNPDRPKGKSVSVKCSVACFIPKPFTPFQFFPQNTTEEFDRKINLLKSSVRSRKISISYHSPKTGIMEAVLARGDRRLGRLLLEVYKTGGVFDCWDEGFSLARWENAFKNCHLSPAFYANRERSYDEINPWDHINVGITKKFLQIEYEKSKRGETTPMCSGGCAGCGIVALTGRKCFDE